MDVQNAADALLLETIVLSPTIKATEYVRPVVNPPTTA
jgi:hypothetical protein